MQLVTLGGAALRLSPPGRQRLERADSFDVDVTGPECNAAVAASRLGAEATWLTRLADGPLGGRVEAAVRSEDVAVVAETTTGRQGVTYYERGATPRGDARVDDLAGAALEGLSMESLPTERVEAADVAYVSAATPTASTRAAGAAAKFLKAAADAEATTATGLLEARGVDPSTARDTLEGLFEVVDVLVASASCLERLFDRGGDLSGVAHGMAAAYDFETVAVRRGGDAAVWRDSTVDAFVSPEVDVVDVTGAADAFAGAFLAGLDGGGGGDGRGDDGARGGDADGPDHGASRSAEAALRRAVAADALAQTTTGPTPAFTDVEIERVAARLERP